MTTMTMIGKRLVLDGFADDARIIMFPMAGLPSS
jgi:hypothetical protein